MSFFRRLAGPAKPQPKQQYDDYLRNYYFYGPDAGRPTMFIGDKYTANAKRYGVAQQAARQLTRQGSSFASARSSLSRQSSGASVGGLSRQSSGRQAEPGSMYGIRYSASRKKWVWDDAARQAALEAGKPKTHARR